jgi:hypothetical protein
MSKVHLTVPNKFLRISSTSQCTWPSSMTLYPSLEHIVRSPNRRICRVCSSAPLLNSLHVILARFEFPRLVIVLDVFLFPFISIAIGNNYFRGDSLNRSDVVLFCEISKAVWENNKYEFKCFVLLKPGREFGLQISKNGHFDWADLVGGDLK